MLILIGCVVIKGFSPKSITKDKVMSDSHIYYRCPSCLTKYQSALEKSGSPINCPSCRHYFLIPSKSTFIPDQDQQQQSTGEQQSKLIDCQDCGASISSIAVACTKCGRPITDDPRLIAISWYLANIYGILLSFVVLLILKDLFRLFLFANYVP